MPELKFETFRSVSPRALRATRRTMPISFASVSAMLSPSSPYERRDDGGSSTSLLAPRCITDVTEVKDVAENRPGGRQESPAQRADLRLKNLLRGNATNVVLHTLYDWGRVSPVWLIHLTS